MSVMVQEQKLVRNLKLVRPAEGQVEFSKLQIRHWEVLGKLQLVQSAEEQEK